MWHIHHRWILVILMTSAAFAQNSDETALCAVMEKFHASLSKEDLDGWASLWSANSPDFALRKQALHQLFAQRDNIEVKHLTVRKVEVNGDTARVSGFAEIVAVDATTRKPAPLGKTHPVLYCVKEEGRWKIFRYARATDELSAAWVAAKTEAEKQALLTADKEVAAAWVLDIIVQGNQLGMQGHHAQALNAFQFAQGVAERIDDKAGIAEALRGIGSVHASQFNYQLALEFYEKARAQFDSLPNRAGARGGALTLNHIGEVHRLQGNFAAALDFFQRALAQFEALGAELEKAATLMNVANVHTALGNYSLALDSYQKSLTLAEGWGAKPIILRVLGNVAALYDRQGNYAQSLKFYEKCLQESQSAGDREGTASALMGLGNVHGAQGNAGLALEFYRKAHVLFEEAQYKPGVLLSLNNMGSIHRVQGEYAQALESYQKSLALANELSSKPDIALVLGNIGQVHASQGNHAAALEFYERSLTIRKEIGDQAGEALALWDIASVHSAQGNHPLALTFAKRAADIAKNIGSLETLWRAYSTVGVSHLALNQHAPARQAYQDAIATIEAMRHQVGGGEPAQQRFFEDKLSPYHGMIYSLVAENQTAEALTYAERAKARTLLDVLRGGRANVTKAMTETERERERTLKDELVSLNAQILREKQRGTPDEKRVAELTVRLQKTRLDYEAFQTRLYAVHPELQVQRGEAKPLTREEATSLLPNVKTALLEFVVTEGNTYLFALTKGAQERSLATLKVYPLGVPRKDLEERVRRFRERLANRDARFAALSRELYNLLLKPAQTQLQGKSHLIIVPDGALWELPFQALQSPDNRFLLEASVVAYAPSLTVLREMRKVRMGVWEYGGMGSKKTPTLSDSHTPTPTLLAFGNPTLNHPIGTRGELAQRGGTLAPLPESEKEVKALRQLYGATRSKIYVGAEAQEERVKAEAGNYCVLHFATHGLLNDGNPMYSQVVLAQMPSPPALLPAVGEGSEDGLLEAWEIMNLNLKADLVVLSACETARGRVGAGEGVVGLTWALFVAGCPTTVVSQWKVTDSSTSELMVEFHRQLKTQPKAETLRQAQLRLMKDGKHQHPFYWAAFVLVGDGS
jgi:CHAT domain-containing protein